MGNSTATKTDQENKINDDNEGNDGNDTKSSKNDDLEWELMEKPDKQVALLNSDLAVGQNHKQISQENLNSKYKSSAQKASKQDLQNIMLHNLQDSNKGIKMTVYHSNKLYLTQMDKMEATIFLDKSQKLITIKPEPNQLNPGKSIHELYLKDIKHIKLNDGGNFIFTKNEHSLNPNESLWFAMKSGGISPVFYGFSSSNNKDDAVVFVQLLNGLMSL